MKTISEIRLENLQSLIEEAGTLEALANGAGTSSVYLSQVRNGTLDQKTGKPRQMGSVIARRLEQARDKPVGWLDTAHKPKSQESAWLSDTLTQASADYFAANDNETDRDGEERPFVALGRDIRLDEDGNVTHVHGASLDSTKCVAIHAPDIGAFALRVRGQGAFPAIRDGWFVVLEPLQSVLEGHYALVRYESGEEKIAEFLFRRGESIELAHLVTGKRMTVERSQLDTNDPMTAVTALLPPCKGVRMA